MDRRYFLVSMCMMPVVASTTVAATDRVDLASVANFTNYKCRHIAIKFRHKYDVLNRTLDVHVGAWWAEARRMWASCYDQIANARAAYGLPIDDGWLERDEKEDRRRLLKNGVGN